MIRAYCEVTLTFALLESPHTELALTFQQESESAGATVGTWPLLLDVTGLGAQAGEILPSRMTGTIKLDNSPGSFGYMRRVGDLLERYTLAGQAATVKLFAVKGDGSEVATDTWAGKCQSVTFGLDGARPTMSVQVQGNGIDEKVVTFCLQSTYANPVGESTAIIPESIGKYLPISFGSPLYIPAIPISAAAPNTARRYALGTGRRAGYRVTNRTIGIGDYSVRNENDSWSLCARGASMDPESYGTTGASTLSLAAYADVAWDLKDYTSDYVITGRSWTMLGSGGAASECVIRQYLLEIDKTSNEVIRELTSGTYALSANDAANAASESFTINIPFDRAIATNVAVYKYAIGFTVSDWASDDAVLKLTSTAADRWSRADGVSSNKLGYDGSDAAPPGGSIAYASFGDSITFDDQNCDRNGNSFAYEELEAGGAVEIHPNDGYENFQAAILTSGIRDLGDITGVVYGPLNRPDWAINLLQKTWDGTSSDLSDSGTWDFTKTADRCTSAFAASGYRTRQLQGYSEGRLTFAEACESICRDTACRVGVTNAGKLFVWPWGLPSADVCAIPAKHIQPLSFEIGNEATVVNQVTVRYAKNPTSMKLMALVSSGDSVNYDAALSWPLTTGDTAELTEESIALYGVRGAKEVTTNWIGSDTSAQTLAYSYLQQFPHPMIMVSFRVPFDLYHSLCMFDTIQFSHPAFPLHFGSNPAQPEPVDDSATGGSAKITEGEGFIAAPYLRGIIEGRFPEYPFNRVPMIRLIVRVLRNSPDDPT